MIILGRSDTTLNVSGIRIGTAEIYSALTGISEVEDTVAVEQNRRGRARPVLFLVLQDKVSLSQALDRRIRDAIREANTPRHAPEEIVAGPAIPRTRSGKLAEKR